jgi:hypothetical protein
MLDFVLWTSVIAVTPLVLDLASKLFASTEDRGRFAHTRSFLAARRHDHFAPHSRHDHLTPYI